MPGYITAQGARDLVAAVAAKQGIEPLLAHIYGIVREHARHGRTSCVAEPDHMPWAPSDRQVKAVKNALEADGFKVVVNFSDMLVIDWGTPAHD